jgi:hypothetical protein
MADGTCPLTRCGIDTVEIARVERLLLGIPHEDLLRIFSKEELCDVGEGLGRCADSHCSGRTGRGHAGSIRISS